MGPAASVIAASLAGAALFALASGPPAGARDPVPALTAVDVVGSGPIVWQRVAVRTAPTRDARVITTLTEFRPDFRPRTILAIRARGDGKGADASVRRRRLEPSQPVAAVQEPAPRRERAPRAASRICEARRPGSGTRRSCSPARRRSTPRRSRSVSSRRPCRASGSPRPRQSRRSRRATNRVCCIDLQHGEAVSAARRDVGGDRPELGPSVGVNDLRVHEGLFARQGRDAGLEPRVACRPAHCSRPPTPIHAATWPAPHVRDRERRDRRADAVGGRGCLVARIRVAAGAACALTAAGGARAALWRHRRDCQSSQNRSRNQCDVHAQLIGFFPPARLSLERAYWNDFELPRA